MRVLLDLAYTAVWLFCVFEGRCRDACFLAAGHVLGLIFASRRAAERVARIERDIAELEKKKVELERCAPSRETVCVLDDEVLLSCGHVVNTRGIPQYLKQSYAAKASCIACGAAAEQKENK